MQAAVAGPAEWETGLHPEPMTASCSYLCRLCRRDCRMPGFSGVPGGQAAAAHDGRLLRTRRTGSPASSGDAGRASCSCLCWPLSPDPRNGKPRLHPEALGAQTAAVRVGRCCRTRGTGSPGFIRGTRSASCSCSRRPLSPDPRNGKPGFIRRRRERKLQLLVLATVAGPAEREARLHPEAPGAQAAAARADHCRRTPEREAPASSRAPGAHAAALVPASCCRTRRMGNPDFVQNTRSASYSCSCRPLSPDVPNEKRVSSGARGLRVAAARVDRCHRTCRREDRLRMECRERELQLLVPTAVAGHAEREARLHPEASGARAAAARSGRCRRTRRTRSSASSGSVGSASSSCS